jgi:hypothetical protein
VFEWFGVELQRFVAWVGVVMAVLGGGKRKRSGVRKVPLAREPRTVGQSGVPGE